MKFFCCIVGIACIGTASTMPLFVENHSFEADDLAPGTFYVYPRQIPGWTSSADSTFDHRVTTQSANASNKDGDHFVQLRDGTSLAQQLDSTLQPGLEYSVSYLLGIDGGSSDVTGTVELYAGGTVADGVVTGGTLLNSQSEFIGVGFTERSFTFIAPASGPLLGQNLSVRLVGPSVPGQASFDDIRIDAVPEPATMLALGAGLAALAARRRRR